MSPRPFTHFEMNPTGSIRTPEPRLTTGDPHRSIPDLGLSVAFRVPTSAQNEEVASNRLILRGAAVVLATARDARARIFEAFPSGGYDSRSGATGVSQR
jgi:hypothetical protein